MTKVDANFLVTDDEGNNIAVISKKANDKQKDFKNKISLAIKEHFCADKAKVTLQKEALKFSASTTEDGETCLRDFTLEKVAVY